MTAYKKALSMIDSEQMIAIQGDTMAPTFTAGDVAIVNHADTQLRDGVFQVEHEGVTMIKRLSVCRGNVTLSNDNQHYPAEEVHFSMVTIKGKVTKAFNMKRL